jgi:hypothetical protein
MVTNSLCFKAGLASLLLTKNSCSLTNHFSHLLSLLLLLLLLVYLVVLPLLLWTVWLGDGAFASMLVHTCSVG